MKWQNPKKRPSKRNLTFSTAWWCASQKQMSKETLLATVELLYRGRKAIAATMYTDNALHSVMTLGIPKQAVDDVIGLWAVTSKPTQFTLSGVGEWASSKPSKKKSTKSPNTSPTKKRLKNTKLS